MTQEILPGIYKIETPLPRSPLGATNSYLIKGRTRNLLIDTGWNREESKEALLAGLAALDVVLEQTDILITHLHADHSGLTAALATEKSTLYATEKDAELVNEMCDASYWNDIGAMFAAYGFPEEDLPRAMQAHSGRRFNAHVRQAFSMIKEGDLIEAGDYSFTCLETPGHTPGHVCLYEPKNKILISGDHILDDITPNITFEKSIADPLGHYLKSLEKVDRLDVSLVLTGHKSLIKNIHKRIGEIKQHHRERLDEVLKILEAGRRNAFQVAGKMSWDISVSSWDLFPLAQKVFAVGEAVTHLEYLRHTGRIKRTETNGKVFYELN